MNIFKEVMDFCDNNHYIDVADKVPIFLCSIGTHIINGVNKCGYCPHIPDEHGSWAIDHCILRHNNKPIYTPQNRLADTRLHIMMRGVKGSGKSVLIHLFLADKVGLLYHKNAELMGTGFRTDIGPNSITEAGLFGSINDEQEIVGKPLAREMCGGFLGFEEMSTLLDAAKKDHSTDITNQLLTSLDNGRVKKTMRDGTVEYLTRYTVWGGSQPGRMDLESGLDRRFFIIDIEMTEAKKKAYKLAAIKGDSMTVDDRIDNADRTTRIQKWFADRTTEVLFNPPTDIFFGDSFNQWLMRDEVEHHEMELYKKLGIGYTVLQERYVGGQPLVVEMDPYLKDLLDASLKMRIEVMGENLALIKTTFENHELTRRDLVMYIADMLTDRDYQRAKRWIEENLKPQGWYNEYKGASTKAGGRRGISVYFGDLNTKPENPQKIIWGEASAK